ncbi:hypothetical protein EVC13_022 [Rhizobium phage RHph_I65]|nr:hypothetical protein EVC13_022 [Rhizobium phage RHph_I65]
MARTVAELTHLIKMARELEDWDLVSALNEERRCAEVDADEAMLKEPVAGTYFVGVYHMDKAYGGPEEGGWYYTTYMLQPDQAVHSFSDMETAKAFAKELNEGILAKENEGLPEISSVLSVGRLIARAFEGELPEMEPLHIPRYE